MDSTQSSAPQAHPFTDEPRECFVCYGGKVFIGHLEMTGEGEEVEVITAVPCRRCNAGLGDNR